MKKLLFVGLICLFAAVAALSASAEGKAAVSPALNIIASHFDMAKTGLIGDELVFSGDDFLRALNLSSIESVTVKSLPDATQGRLMLGTTAVSEGQKISRVNLGLLVFSPAADVKCNSSFDFSYDDCPYSLKCNLYMIKDVNKSPVAAYPTGLSPEVATNPNKSVTGKLSAYDPEDDDIRFDVVSYPSHGLLIMCTSGDGSYTYLPEANFKGDDSFRYVARDKYGNYSAAVSVSLKVS